MAETIKIRYRKNLQSFRKGAPGLDGVRPEASAGCFRA